MSVQIMGYRASVITESAAEKQAFHNTVILKGCESSPHINCHTAAVDDADRHHQLHGHRLETSSFRQRRCDELVDIPLQHCREQWQCLNRDSSVPCACTTDRVFIQTDRGTQAVEMIRHAPVKLFKLRHRQVCPAQDDG